MFKDHLDASGIWCRMQVYIYDVKYTDLILSKCGNLNLCNSEWLHLFYEILCFFVFNYYRRHFSPQLLCDHRD